MGNLRKGILSSAGGSWDQGSPLKHMDFIVQESADLNRDGFPVLHQRIQTSSYLSTHALTVDDDDCFNRHSKSDDAIQVLFNSHNVLKYLDSSHILKKSEYFT